MLSMRNPILMQRFRIRIKEWRKIYHAKTNFKKLE